MMNTGHILLADDDSDLALLVQLGFQQAGILNPVDVVSDGQEAIGYLSGEGGYADREAYPLPWLVMLDARLRLVTGLEVLVWLRQQPALSGIRIVMFSSIGTETDARLAQEVGADCFMVKPFEFQELVGTVKRLGELPLPTGGLITASLDAARFDVLRHQPMAHKRAALP